MKTSKKLNEIIDRFEKELDEFIGINEAQELTPTIMKKIATNLSKVIKDQNPWRIAKFKVTKDGDTFKAVSDDYADKYNKMFVDKEIAKYPSNAEYLMRQKKYYHETKKVIRKGDERNYSYVVDLVQVIVNKNGTHRDKSAFIVFDSKGNMKSVKQYSPEPFGV